MEEALIPLHDRQYRTTTMLSKNHGNIGGIHRQFGPVGRIFMCASCLACAACLAWLFVNLRSEIEPSKKLEHPDTLRFHLAHQAATPADKERQEKIISDYSRMRCWHPALVQLSLIITFVGSACAIVAATRFAFPGRASPLQAVQAAAKDGDRPPTGV